MQVSDEFTVPLCRDHHRQLHQAGSEVTWWEDLGIDALEIAKALWEQTPAITFSARAPGSAGAGYGNRQNRGRRLTGNPTP